MSSDRDPSQEPYEAPLSMHPKTVRNRSRRDAEQMRAPKGIARIGAAVDAIGRLMKGWSDQLGGAFVPASRKARRCAKCGIETWEHRKDGKAWVIGPCKGKSPVSIAPSLLQLGRVANVYPNAILTQDGGSWSVREPLTGFVRGRGNSRRAALRAAFRGGSRRAS